MCDGRTLVTVPEAFRSGSLAGRPGEARVSKSLEVAADRGVSLLLAARLLGGVVALALAAAPSLLPEEAPFLRIGVAVSMDPSAIGSRKTADWLPAKKGSEAPTPAMRDYDDAPYDAGPGGYAPGGVAGGAWKPEERPYAQHAPFSF